MKRLLSLALVFPALAVLAAEPQRIVTLGDSITKGVRPGVKAEETFAARLEAGLRAGGADVSVVNVGIGGERTDMALKRLAKDVLAQKPGVVTIMYGTNDSYVDQGKSASRITVEEYRANLGKLVDELRAVGIAPVLMTEPRWGKTARLNGAGEHPNARLEKYVEACRAVAAEKRTPLVDHFQHWTAAEAKGTDIGGWTTDQCHPNPEGHRVLVELMLPVVRAALKPAP
jgi:lysophospholipase L1-like esterase